MNCPTCGSLATIEDNFCRRCGTSVRNSRLPVERAPAQPPALLHRAAPVVVRASALMVAGFVAEWLLRSATKKAVRAPFQARKKDKSRAVASRETAAVDAGEIAVSETLYLRRTIVRR
jgi:hypothetical protein